MKKLALAVVLIAFGALMLTGCPEENKAANGTKTTGNTATNTATNAADNAK